MLSRNLVITVMLNKTPNQPLSISGFEPIERIAGNDAGGLLLLGDHANKNIPDEYDRLGLAEAEISRHIACDIGSRALTIALAERLAAPAIMARFSRLLIDPNRGEDDPTLIMQISDRAVVPGNAVIDPAEREKRLDDYYRPYHTAITSQLDLMVSSGRIPVLFSVHSFTHSWRGISRPWHVGILWDQDPRLAVPVIDGLRRQSDLVVGDNEPYKGSLSGDTMYRHGTSRGLAHALVEVRQDLIHTDEGVTEWADRLTPILEGILGGKGLHKVKLCGSQS